eukprot:jgi/Psemu1/7918/gm1.7918_g
MRVFGNGLFSNNNNNNNNNNTKHHRCTFWNKHSEKTPKWLNARGNQAEVDGIVVDEELAPMVSAAEAAAAAAAAAAASLPPPPPLRLVTIPPGTLLGFKACPGPDGSRLLGHASSTPGDASVWSGIYVQLSLAQAVSYVPNQYDRGETTCSVCSIKTTTTATTMRSFRVAISDDPVMARAGVSSSDKARRVLESVRRTEGLSDWAIPEDEEKEDPMIAIVDFFGKHDHSLCLVDCENYELAVPHSLFASEYLSLDPVLVLERSTAIPGGVIGRMEFLPEMVDNHDHDSNHDSNHNPETPELLERRSRRAAHDRLPGVRASELADASSLGPMLEERFETHELLDAVRTEWFSLAAGTTEQQKSDVT